MKNLGEIITKTESIDDIQKCFEFIDSLTLSPHEFKQVIEVRCKTLKDCNAAYTRYGQKLFTQEHLQNMLSAANSPNGYCC
jgi:hypothetical protein